MSHRCNTGVRAGVLSPGRCIDCHKLTFVRDSTNLCGGCAPASDASIASSSTPRTTTQTGRKINRDPLHHMFSDRTQSSPTASSSTASATPIQSESSIADSIVIPTTTMAGPRRITPYTSRRRMPRTTTVAANQNSEVPHFRRRRRVASSSYRRITADLFDLAPSHDVETLADLQDLRTILLDNDSTDAEEEVLWHAILASLAYDDLCPHHPDISTKEAEKWISELQSMSTIPVDDCCSICLCTYSDTDDDIVQLPCLHPFHKPCIVSWISKGSNTCPMCREKCITIF